MNSPESGAIPPDGNLSISFGHVLDCAEPLGACPQCLGKLFPDSDHPKAFNVD
jgi:hypothetical protein